jgi:hypothetical protein
VVLSNVFSNLTRKVVTKIFLGVYDIIYLELFEKSIENLPKLPYQ